MEGDNIGKVVLDFFGYHWRGILTIIVPLVLIPMPILAKSSVYNCAYIIIVMAIYWTTEILPPYITALIPVVMFPILGVLDSDVVCKQYMRDSIFLFIAGIVVAIAVEHCNLHKRLAYCLIRTMGCNLRRLHFGIMILATLISICVNNVATTLLMCPVADIVLKELEAQKLTAKYVPATEKDVVSKYAIPVEEEIKYPSKTYTGLYLGVAYASTLGGTVTQFGTVTNLMYEELYKKHYPGATDQISNISIMAYTAPFIIFQLICAYFILQIIFFGMFRKQNTAEGVNYDEASAAVKTAVKEKLGEMGLLSVHEWQVLILCILLIVLLFFRDPGWGDLAEKGLIHNSWPLVLVLLALFVIPKDYTFFKYCFGSAPFTSKTTPSLVTWKVVNSKMPWGLMLVIGNAWQFFYKDSISAAYSIGEAIRQTKLAEKLAYELRGAEQWPVLCLQFVCVLITVIVTIFCSNVAVCSVAVPIVAELARVCAIHPLTLILPTGVACSASFLLPVSTPPNAIVSTTASIRTKHMLLAGVGPTIIAILMLFIISGVWHYLIFPASDTFPDWAQAKSNSLA